MAIVALITFRDDLRARLRQAGHAGVPLLADAATMIASYLSAERDLGRVAAGADVGARDSIPGPRKTSPTRR